ncbi:PIN-like domain-containing protein [Bacillus toyonensis]|uniref:PIN-like domain-containing protein n=1 Tax=Bacillus toyonensis TaxID=155322 RepID=UPI001C7343A6|nr:PIN domain-containing protein [Bacillus toyonensis]MBX0352936.1 PIN domain-containing protein [Bacillus toyonensis]
MTEQNQEPSQVTTIASIIESDNYCVIFDTNIYLNLYEYAPDTTEFFISLCNLIQDKLVLPSTVKREFDKNHADSLNRQRNKFKNTITNLKKPVNQFEAKLKKQVDILNTFKIPMISELQAEIKEDIESLTQKLDAYAQEHEGFEEMNRTFLDTDIIFELINNIARANNLLPHLSIDEIYQLCIDGEKRYTNKIPPGYKDGEKKSGVQAYGDFFIWKEALKFCHENNKNLIFVTDDVKEDWYELENKRRVGFRKELISEFETGTDVKVVGVTTSEFFNELATIFNKEIPNTVEWIISYDLENYFDQLKTMIGPEIAEMLLYTNERYVDTSSLSNYESSDFKYVEDSFNLEVVSVDFQGYHVDEAEYLLNVNVTGKAISREYLGINSNTNEVIFSSPRYHILEGDFEVKITRYIDSYLDYWYRANIFDEIYIVDGLFYETSTDTADDICVECVKNVGSYFNDKGEPICDNCIANTSNGTVCTTCGRKIPFDKMYDGSTCNSCFQELD